MRVESLSSRVDFDERRARSLETVVQYRPGPARPSGGAEPSAPAVAQPSQSQAAPGQPDRPSQAPSAGEGPGGEQRRRRRRRRRRRPGQTMAEGSQSGWQNRNANEPDADGNQPDIARASSDSDTTEPIDGPFDADGPDGPDDSDQ